MTRGCSEASIRCCRRSRRQRMYKFADGFLLRQVSPRLVERVVLPRSACSADPRDHQNTALLGMVWVIGSKTVARKDMLDVVFVAVSVILFVAGAGVHRSVARATRARTS